MACNVCKKEKPDGHACARTECPHRKPGTSLRDEEHHVPPPWAGRHDGLGWDRFYRGRRKAP